jgi:transcriptional regulator with XRE-family HTH domain
MVGTSPGMISFVERDRNRPNYEIIAKIAHCLDTTTDYLIFGDNGKNNNPEPLEIISDNELVDKHNIVNRMVNLSPVDQKIILQILTRMERKTQLRSII